MEGIFKTPVAILNEKMAKKGITPVYELIFDGTRTNHPTFKYQVKCDEVVAHGTGRCKKVAKHDAAEAMLTKLGILNDEGACSEFSTGTLHQIVETVEEKPVQVSALTLPHTHSENLNLNAMQELLNLCKARSFSTPEFSTSCSGPPHAPYFTVSCKVENYLEEGLAASKKVAKRDAVQKMVNRIKKTEDSSSKVQEIVNSTFESNNNDISDCQSIPISQLTKREKFLLSLCASETKLNKASSEKMMPPEIEEQLDVVKKSIEKLLTLI